MGVTIRKRRNHHLIAIELQTPQALSRKDIISCIGDVSPLSEFFKTTTCDDIERNAGLGVRRYSGQGKNCNDALKDGFSEFVKKMLLIQLRKRSYPNVSTEYALHLRRNALTTAEYLRPPRAATPGSAYQAHDNINIVELGEDTVDSVREVDVVRDILDNPSVSFITVGGCPLSKKVLIDWALRANQKVRSVENMSTQTDQPFSRQVTFVKLPLYRDACVDTQGLVTMESKETMSVNGATAQLTNPKASTIPAKQSKSTNPPAAGSLPHQSSTAAAPARSSTSAIPSLMGDYTNSVSSGRTAGIPSLLGDIPNSVSSGGTSGIPSLLDISTTSSTDAGAATATEVRFDQDHSTLDGYEKAKNWRPQNTSQRKEYEQAVQEIYLMLVVGKGVRLNSLCSEFLRVTQVRLDFTKIGVPDLKTLLVQMRDLIFLKKHYYSGDVYIFPNKSTERFKSIAHIEELVSEQRNDHNVIPDPNSPSLQEMNVKELFFDSWPSYSASVQPTAYGSYNPYYWSRNGNNYGYGSNSRHQWNNQYQQQYAYQPSQSQLYYQYDMYMRQNNFFGVNQRN